MNSKAMEQVGAANLLVKNADTAGAPVTVTFQVTDRCNYECVHCYQEHVDRDELSFEEVSRILGEIADLGVLFLTLVGGEFFMRPDANKILQRAHDLGFAIKLLSTGHHIHEKRADFLRTIRPLQVDLSLYGASKDKHEAVTDHPGSWERTIAAAKRLIERDIPVQLKAPVMEQNAAEINDLTELASSMGALFSADAKITTMEDAGADPVWLRMRGDTLQTFYRDKEKGIATQMHTLFEGFDPSKQWRKLDHTPCRAGQESCSIDQRGEVRPCQSLNVSMGSLRKQSFREVWFGSEGLDEIRNLTWADISECNRCEVRNYCQRCHAMALLEHGEMRGPSLEACRHAVAVRDSLRDAGIVPADHTALPPTWDRVDPDGLHEQRQISGQPGIRPSKLRVIV